MKMSRMVHNRLQIDMCLYTQKSKFGIKGAIIYYREGGASVCGGDQNFLG